MDRHFKQVLCTGIVLLLLLLQTAASGQERFQFAVPSSEKDLLDSLLQTFSIEELVKFRQFYLNEIERLEREKRLLQRKGIRDGEKLLANTPDSPFMDKILIRLAEFSYQQAQEDYLRNMEEYEKNYAAYEQGLTSEPPEEPKVDYSETIAKYRLLLEKFPNSPLVDDALYHLAFTLEQSNRKDEAIPYYLRVVQNHATSTYAPEAFMRLGEYYFNPPIRDIPTAISYYRRILNYKNTARYDEALYKLGWGYYLQQKYPEAISMFTTLVQDIEKASILDPTGELTNPALKEESLEYIGICFHDYGGLPQALSYLDSLGSPSYGVEILLKLGDIYKDNEENYPLAMSTYRALLQRYPWHASAPDIQEKIVACAQRLEDFQEIYRTQKQLFETYQPGSEWATHIKQQIEDQHKAKKIIANAEQKAEAALRQNINLLLQYAERLNDTNLFKKAVEDSRTYLEHFPADTNAYAIHWNMAVILDSKLNLDDQAYLAYLDICNQYEQDRFRKYAAQNAIVLAREKWERETGGTVGTLLTKDSTQTISDMQSAIEKKKFLEQKVQPDSLTPAEHQLVEAYDNFILHFPEDKETAAVLANAGALYYNKHDFTNALKYFNTLIRRFPGSPEISTAQFNVMESYFGRHDFVSAEIAAKRLLAAPTASKKLKEKARRRMAESIYLHAETIARQNNHLKAAQEFRRVVEEVPDARFADLALFQAAIQYDLAKEYNRAIEAYQYLINSYPKSKHYLDAINNIAIDYGELKEYQRAANMYEKLADEHPDSAKAQDALYNASYFFVQAQDWKNAIRVNRKYVNRYPHAPDAENMFYDIAGFYLKLDDLDNANKIYGEFTTRYPNSPRSVETFYRRGEYYLNKGMFKNALHEFEQATAKNEDLKRKGLPTNDFYAAEALFQQSEIEYRDYAAIRFTLKEMKSAQQRKKELLQKLINQYTRVAAYGTIRLYQASYNIGKTYEEFARTWANQQIPPMDETQKVVFLSKLNQTSGKLYEKAFASYKNTLKVLRKLVDNYQQTPPDSIKESGRVAPEDSTVRVANRWINLTGEKVSEMLYRIAELNYESIERLLNAPIPSELDEVAVLEYRHQVLQRAVKPVVQQILTAHFRNLSEADSLQLHNIWVDRSKKKITLILNIQPKQYRQLCFDTFETYKKKYQTYKRIMLTGTEEEQESALTLAGELLNLIELFKGYATEMDTCYQDAVAKMSGTFFAPEAKQRSFAEYVNTTHELATRLKTAADSCRIMKDYFSVKFQEDERTTYEDAMFTYSDNYISLKETALELCKNVYQFKKQNNLSDVLFAKVATLMIELDPNNYAQEFQLPLKEYEIASDTTWKVTLKPEEEWTLGQIDDENWKFAIAIVDTNDDGTVFSKLAIPSLYYPVSIDTQKISVEDSTTYADVSPDTTTDTTKVTIPQVAKGPKRYSELYFLKNLALEMLPVTATLYLECDDNSEVFINGIKVFSEDSDTLGWGQVFETDVLEFLTEGRNVVALHLWDQDLSGKGARWLLRTKGIEKETLGKKEAQIAQQETLSYRKIVDMIFNRHRIPAS